MQHSDPTRCLWIHGGAGIGKTFISAHIVQHLHTISSHHLAYFFCVYDDEEKCRPTYILRSFIAQIAMQSVDAFQAVKKMREGKEMRSLTPVELWSLFRKIVTDVQNCRFVIDGFDECQTYDPDTRSHFSGARSRFLQELLASITYSTATVLVVSRDEADIRDALDRAALPVLTYAITQDDTRSDIEIFASSIVFERLSSHEKAVQEEIASGLSSKAQGMFLWVRLEKDRIKSSHTLGQLRRTISTMPTGLHHLYQTYERSLLAISALQEQGDRERAQNILRWVLFAPRPLSVRELSEALLVRDGMNELPQEDMPETIGASYIHEQISALCGSLITVRESAISPVPADSTVHLAHFSVKEFLLRNRQQTSESNLSVDCYEDTKYNHGLLAKTCLTYLLFSDFAGGPCLNSSLLAARHAKFAFLNYASMNWPIHARLHGSLLPESSDLLDSDSVPANYKAWLQVYHGNMSSNNIHSYECDPPLHYCALFGLTEELTARIRRGADVNVRGARYGSPLQAAVAAGNAEIVSILLESNATLSNQSDTGNNELHTAAERGHESITILLLNADHDGAARNAQNRDGNTPLHLAVENCHSSVAEHLVLKGTDASIQNTQGHTALHLIGGDTMQQTALVSLLAVNPQVSNLQDSAGRTALHFLVYGENTMPTIQALIKAGADVEPPSTFEESILFSALRGHANAVAIKLLRNGADPQRRCWGGRTTPIHMAARRHFNDVLGVMLETGVNINITDNYGVTPLHDAIGSNDDDFGTTDWSEQGDDTVKLLLDHGADITCVATIGFGSHRLTPLAMSVFRGLSNCTKAILKQLAGNVAEGSGLGGDVVDRHGGSGLTITHMAAKSAQPASIITVLADAHFPIDVTCRDKFGYTPLHFAAQKSKEAVEILLKYGADVNAVTNAGMTPLRLAGQPSIAHILKEALVNVDA